MPAIIPRLIEEVDSLEIIRDQIAGILLLELANQRALAAAAGKSPDPWDLAVFTESGNPWAVFDQAVEGKSPPPNKPIVNVSFNDDAADMSRSNIIERTVFSGVFHIDCYGCGISSRTDDGHDPGDARAAMESQRAARLCRNILMSAMYVDLGLPDLVWRRWVTTRTSLGAAVDSRSAPHVMALRLALQVDFNEFSPQWEGQPLELISIEIDRAENGEVLLRADYPHTP